MSDDFKAPADLSSLGIDLSDMFRPAWTTETSDTSARLAAQFDDGDRPHRYEGRGGDRGRERGPGRDARSPRPERGPRPNRPNRPEGPGQGGQGRGPGQENRGRGTRGEGNRERNDRRAPRDERDRRPEPAPKPCLEGWKLQLIPEVAAIEGIAKQIRSRAKAYPLFELARLIVQLSDRYSIRLQAESGGSQELFRVKLDGSLWPTRKEAISHLLSKHLGAFYKQSSVTTDAPKGAFAVVAQCGMSGVVLGPPNHHEYTSRLIALHASRFKNLPFEVYKSRIRMMRDEMLIDQWKTEQSTKTIYTPVTRGEPPTEASDITPPTDPVAEVAETIKSDNPEVAVTEESVEEREPQVAEAPVGLEVESVAQVATQEPSETTSGGEPTEPTKAIHAEIAGESQSDGGFSFAEAASHFQQNHADEEVVPAGEDISLKGGIALHGSTPLLRELLLKNLQEMDRFPLTLAQVLGKELTGRGLQLFKSHKKIINVSVARPRYLDRESTPIGESFKAILEYLEAHPKQHRDKQWSALLALRTEKADQPDMLAETVISIPAEQPLASASTDATEPTESTEPTKPETPRAVLDEATLKRREQALGADLLWLLHQGHVIDFAMGNLQAATRPAPKTPNTTESQASKETQIMDETLTGDTDSAQQGGSATMSSEKPQDELHEPLVHHESLEIPEGAVIAPPPSSEPGDPGEALPH